VSKPEAAREHMDLSCSIADIADLSRGAYARIWTPFHALIEQDGAVQARVQTGIGSLLDRVAAPRLAERFSHYFSFKQALLRRDTGPLAGRKKALTRYVNVALRQEAAPLTSGATPQAGPSGVRGTHHSTHELTSRIVDAFYGGPEERLFMGTLLTLALSDQQKDIMAHIARHPYLERSDLLSLLRHRDERLLARQITPLINLKLVKVYPWGEAATWRERERYYLHEPALRFLAQRHGLSPAYYLEPSYADKRARESTPTSEGRQAKRALSPLSREVTWVQRGAWGLRRKDGAHMTHTSGTYRCVRSILEASYRSRAYQVRYWKSARESQRLYYDPIDGDKDKIRPDAELLYTTRASASARSLLIEYDRDTTTLRQLSDKFLCYLEYQYDTRSTLPAILVITQSEQAQEKIWDAIADAKAFDVSIIVVLEEHVLQDGLLPILAQLDQAHASLLQRNRQRQEERAANQSNHSGERITSARRSR